MHHAASRRTAAAGSILCLIGLLTLAGCQEDEITHAIVPRAAEPEKTRLVGVICPHGDKTWFFKLMGPESAFDDALPAFDQFVGSVRFPDKADQPTWTVPEGWKTEKAPEPDVAAFTLGPAEKPLKCTVATLPKKPDSEVADNVNRWRGQLGLGPLGDAEAAALADKVAVNNDPAFRVDLTGPGKRTAKARALTYQTPDGWTENPHPEMGRIPAEAAFQVEDGGETAEVTVTALAGQAGGLPANIDRWRGQIDAPPVAPDQLDKAPTLTVAGRESPYLDLTGKKGRILGVIVARGDKTWFFKMKGPADLVEKQKSKFEEFLKSVKFDAAQGGQS